MDTAKLRLSVQLRIVRAIKGYSQTQLAEKIGISRATLAKYEEGYTPTFKINERKIEEVLQEIEQEVINGTLNEQEKEKTKKKREEKKKRKVDKEYKI